MTKCDACRRMTHDTERIHASDGSHLNICQKCIPFFSKSAPKRKEP